MAVCKAINNNKKLKAIKNLYIYINTNILLMINKSETFRVYEVSYRRLYEGYIKRLYEGYLPYVIWKLIKVGLKLLYTNIYIFEKFLNKIENLCFSQLTTLY